eukprot:TRINITY_DN113_c1_g1_i1.p1 TRINITY_DN113_c1_g1~~TRINITY_DN113_c1_g1_i1.p1  ORF type:complete len:579 (-),score=112.78 TRINITY_DN113_c1_g1_i1:1264-3000(-)
MSDTPMSPADLLAVLHDTTDNARLPWESETFCGEQRLCKGMQFPEDMQNHKDITEALVSNCSWRVRDSKVGGGKRQWKPEQYWVKMVCNHVDDGRNVHHVRERHLHPEESQRRETRGIKRCACKATIVLRYDVPAHRWYVDQCNEQHHGHEPLAAGAYRPGAALRECAPLLESVATAQEEWGVSNSTALRRYNAMRREQGLAPATKAQFANTMAQQTGARHKQLARAVDPLQEFDSEELRKELCATPGMCYLVWYERELRHDPQKKGGRYTAIHLPDDGTNELILNDDDMRGEAMSIVECVVKSRDTGEEGEEADYERAMAAMREFKESHGIATDEVPGGAGPGYQQIESPEEDWVARVIGVAWVSTFQMLEFARNPEAFQVDATCSTNNKHWSYTHAIAMNAEWKSVTGASAIMHDDTTRSTNWFWCTVLTLIYRHVLLRTSAVLTDEDGCYASSVRSGISLGLYAAMLSVLLCYWHLVVHNLLQHIKHRDDGWAANMFQKAMWHLATHPRTPEEFKILHKELRSELIRLETEKAINEITSQELRSWLTTLVGKGKVRIPSITGLIPSSHPLRHTLP